MNTASRLGMAAILAGAFMGATGATVAHYATPEPKGPGRCRDKKKKARRKAVKQARRANR